MRWFHVIMVGCVGCELTDLVPAAPVADFSVRCATEACEVAVAAAVPVKDATYRWSIGDEVVGQGEELDVPLDSGELERVTLEVETRGGTSRYTQVLLHTEAVGEGADGEPVSLAHGYMVVGEQIDAVDRIVVTTCSEKIVVTSFIGGCFTGGNLYVKLSPPSYSAPGYGDFSNNPATFSLGGGPMVEKGDWDGAQAYVDGAVLVAAGSAWADEPTENSFETLLAPTVIPRWMFAGGDDFKHKEAVAISCDDDTIVVGKSEVGGVQGWPVLPR